MTQLEDLGTWRNLGGMIAPSDEWLSFPLAATEGSPLFRARFSGVDLNRLPSNRFYLRSVYGGTADNRWVRIFPGQTHIINIPVLLSCSEEKIFRTIQLKRNRYWQGYDDVLCDAITVYVDEFVKIY